MKNVNTANFNFCTCLAKGCDGDNDNVMKNIEAMAAHRFSESFHAFTELCLQYNPSKRPGISQLLAHKFIKQCKKTDNTLLDILKPVKPLNECFVESTGESLIN